MRMKHDDEDARDQTRNEFVYRLRALMREYGVKVDYEEGYHCDSDWSLGHFKFRCPHWNGPIDADALADILTYEDVK